MKELFQLNKLLKLESFVDDNNHCYIKFTPNYVNIFFYEWFKTILTHITVFEKRRCLHCSCRRPQRYHWSRIDHWFIRLKQSISHYHQSNSTDSAYHERSNYENSQFKILNRFFRNIRFTSCLSPPDMIDIMSFHFTVRKFNVIRTRSCLAINNTWTPWSSVKKVFDIHCSTRFECPVTRMLAMFICLFSLLFNNICTKIWSYRSILVRLHLPNIFSVYVWVLYANKIVIY